MTTQRDLLTTKQAAARLGVSRFTLYRLIARGELFALKDDGEKGGYWLDPDEVDALATERAR